MTEFEIGNCVLFSKEFDCPSIPVLGVCSNQGTCDDTTGTCTCDEGFQGIQCLGKYIESIYKVINLRRDTFRNPIF